ncbi:APC family permease [Streptomyces griseorubiginosus]|uniref:Amino acid permease n=1 Tax=Streptomyces griseorubiginosus TaxID=67304 RepID=A0A117P324_9ACTN|nr:APC family permease [Streptomyces griseorubiginosus]KUM72156.1 amino acid permease [Streptomyces griseorubiginosus]KUN68056.1 amino acid permease [Streptomyces griseorubiginosus]
MTAGPLTKEPAGPPAAAQSERQKLRKHFGRFDILFFLLCTIVGVDTIGTVASKGAEAFTWLIVLALVFFVPSALLTAELGAAFPDEGGPYIWTSRAFGRLAGAVNNFLYWITNPVWLGGTLSVSAVTAYTTFFNDGKDLSTPAFYVFTLVFVWVGVLAAILSFDVGKWIPTVGAWSRFLLLGLFTVTVVVYGVQHGLHGFGLGDFSPTYAGFVGLVPVLMFNFVGFELPSTAGDEMTDAQKDVPYAVFRSAALSVLLYALPILGILLVLPVKAISGLGGFIDAIRQVFTVYGGHVAGDGTASLSGAGSVLGDLAAVLFILTVLSSGVTWVMGSDRALAVSGYDGAAPRFLGVISSRFGTPVRVNVLSGLVSTAVLVLAHELTNGSAAKLFGAVLGLAVSTTLVSYLGIFPALAVLRRRAPGVPRPYRAPAPLLISIVLTVLVVFATVQLVAPGAGDHWFGSAYAPSGWSHAERGKYLLTELVPLVGFMLLGVLFWALGRPTRRAEAALRETPAG